MDFDGDGIPDILSGSWPGELYFFKGLSKGKYASGTKIKDKDGKTINVGGGIRDSGDYLLITGDATFEKDEKGNDVVVYEGKRIEVPEGKQAGITGCASALHVFDWNGDGLLDLLVGDIGGQIHLLLNEGSPKQHAFGKGSFLEAGGKKIQVQHGDAHPFVADWDGDGLPDLLAGDGAGNVVFFRNEGSAKAPKLAIGVTLVHGPKSHEPIKTPEPGTRAKICVVDWDGDGRLDLLVGDVANLIPDRPKKTEAEEKELAKLRERKDRVMKHWQELIQKVSGPQREKDKKKLELILADVKDVQKEMQDLYAKLPPEVEYHGWVWLYRRKTPEVNAMP